MQKEIDKKDFDLSLAKQGHPLVTRNGRKVKFIAYVPEALEGAKLLILLGDKVYNYYDNGEMYGASFEDSKDLFLAPVGYCEGLPVFPNDVLIGTDDNPVYKQKEFVVTLYCDTFTKFKWPSKNVVVKTRMSYKDLEKHYFHHAAEYGTESWSSDSAENLANKAIERAISDGDVIPTSVVEKLAGDAYNMRLSGGCYTFVECIQQVMEEYKAGLTK